MFVHYIIIHSATTWINVLKIYHNKDLIEEIWINQAVDFAAELV